METSKYLSMSPDKLENHMNDYLIDHWSVSSLNTFRRNEKAFEKDYIYLDRSYKNSVSSLIGTIYHKVLESFFKTLKDEKRELSEDDLLELAFKKLSSIPDESITPPANKTVEDALDEILKGVKSVISNFYAEKNVYTDMIKEIIMIEEKITTFIIFNGKHVELPVVSIPDIVFRDKDGKIRIMDHKTCRAYTKPSEINMHYSTQSIVYKKVVEAHLKETVHAFHFFENKVSKNRDGSSQIKGITISMDKEAQLFYEAFIGESIQKMINAVKDPNYIYLANPNDFLQDSTEMLEFWNKTRISVDFDGLTKKQLNILKKKKLEEKSFDIPNMEAMEVLQHNDDLLLLSNKEVMNLPVEQKIEYALLSQGLRAKVNHIIDGYSTDTYLLSVPPTTNINRIFKYELNIGAILGATNVRILKNLVPYEDSVYVAVEVPKKKRKYPSKYMSGINKIPLGVDNYGNNMHWDLDCPYTPHMLLSGASGSGKSYLLDKIINSVKGVKVHILDPKREFGAYNSIQELEDIERFIEEKVVEMDEIYKKGKTKTQLIIFDEAADCFARQKKVKDENFKTLEQNVMLLAQKARSAGIHMLLAAQRFSVNVLSGDAQANFPVRLCLRVARDIDSKVMLGEVGAEKLLGNGDGLLQTPDLPNITRIQCYK